MAELLTKALATTCKRKETLDVVVGWSEATAEIDLNADPNATLRMQGALPLRKARIHTLATLRANDSNNLHSLAVQMRPALECAGQVVFTFRNAYIAPDLLMSREKAVETLTKRLNADFYRTLRSSAKGAVSADDLRGMVAEAEAAAPIGETPLI